MSEVLDFYVQEAANSLSSIPWLAKYQQQARSDLERMGFPTRHCEDWKYTVLDSFAKNRFKCIDVTKSLYVDVSACPLSQSKNQKETVLTTLPFASGESVMVTVLNGQCLDIEDYSKQLPAGVLIKPLSHMISEHAALIRPYLNQILQPSHGFHALNSAMLHHGVVIYLPKGVCVDKPIFIRHWQDKPNQAVYQRHLIIALPESSATVIEAYSGEEGIGYFTNTVTEVSLAEQAQITHYKLQCEGQQAFHVGDIRVRQEESSEFFSHSLSLGGCLVRSDLTISLQEKNACCLLNGIYIADDNQHIDHHTRVNHAVPECISEQDYKGILKGRSRAVFNGQVHVANGAQKTRANQQNKTILLSAEAEIDTKPQLEIFADDVVCSHGATVGQLDEEAMFYLSSRGMDEAQVTRYLIQAFIANNMQLVKDATLCDWMLALINEKLRTIDHE
ncbi:MAG: Fe-S cluster assembly protein SufD [Legionellales bacterium RIFCSPHIGHO2_12_FULL_42_9]|nr:MAG: Fe-S cluster assembly protein SufD [Legionellales bacterium RIFCSPHIGHO2_12_FULL_42_9]